jgi:hypothetical protein
MRARRSHLAATLLPALLGIACSQTTVEGLPRVSLAATPADVTSGLDALDVVVDVAVGPAGAQTIESMVAGATLASWPALEPMPTVTVPSATTAPVMSVDFRPAAAVAEGWYALVVPKPPANGVLLPTSFHVLPDGRGLVRAHVGSAPVIRGESVCPKGSGTMIAVGISEPVRPATTATTMPITIAAGPASAPAPCKFVSGPLSDAPGETFEFLCPTPLARKDVVSMSVSDDLTSASGSGASVPLGERVSALDTFDADALMGGCASLTFDP